MQSYRSIHSEILIPLRSDLLHHTSGLPVHIDLCSLWNCNNHVHHVRMKVRRIWSCFSTPIESSWRRSSKSYMIPSHCNQNSQATSYHTVEPKPIDLPNSLSIQDEFLRSSQVFQPIRPQKIAKSEFTSSFSFSNLARIAPKTTCRLLKLCGFQDGKGRTPWQVWS